MRSTIQTTPLLISYMLRYGTTVHANQSIDTWTGDGCRRTTFAEVGTKAAQLAHALRGLGITGDQRVATFMWNNAEHAIAYLAVPSMGAVLHALNIRLFPQQIVYVATHADNKVVIVDNSLAKPFSQLLPHLKTIRHVIVNGPVDEETWGALQSAPQVEGVHDWDRLLGEQTTAFDWPDLTEDCASSMCYTSGTTGHPKGVVYSHRGNYLHATAVAQALGVHQGDRMLVVVPLFHANAWGFPYLAMLFGVSMVMPDRFLQAEPLARMIESERVTTGAGVPTIWNDLMHYLEQNPTDVSSCRLLMVGGSAAPPAMLKQFEHDHGIKLIHGWGMTEMSPVGTLAVAPAEAKEGSEEYWAHRCSQGRLVAGVDARLVDFDGRDLPWDGQSVGELEVRGPWITAEYYSNGTESEAEIAEMRDRFNDGWLRTGDIGMLTPDGFLTLTDRSKDIIKSGGEWISSVDLENALMGHPDVHEASVVGVPDERWGERPLANLVLREGSSAKCEDVRDWLGERISRWMVPERWSVIEEVPKTSVGKFDKKVLRQRYTEGELPVQVIPHRH
ncbi:MAG: long-chain fatty acid--CoA ligase [Dermatophilaceae bacterium]